ncbi:hypothetical protein BKA80DRAFT_266212 [Phyllosticta citrichinensis]
MIGCGWSCWLRICLKFAFLCFFSLGCTIQDTSFARIVNGLDSHHCGYGKAWWWWSRSKKSRSQVKQAGAEKRVWPMVTVAQGSRGHGKIQH